jgi:hypothetical protein
VRLSFPSQRRHLHKWKVCFVYRPAKQTCNLQHRPIPYWHRTTRCKGTFCLLWLSINLSNQLPQHNPGVYYLDFFFLARWWPNKHKKQFRKQNIVNIERHDMKLEVEEAKYGQLLCLHTVYVAVSQILFPSKEGMWLRHAKYEYTMWPRKLLDALTVPSNIFSNACCTPSPDTSLRSSWQSA